MLAMSILIKYPLENDAVIMVDASLSALAEEVEVAAEEAVEVPIAACVMRDVVGPPSPLPLEAVEAANAVVQAQATATAASFVVRWRRHYPDVSLARDQTGAHQGHLWQPMMGASPVGVASD